MDAIIKADLFRYTGKGGFGTLMKCLKRDPGFRFMFFFRLCQKYPVFHPKGFLARYFYHVYFFKYCIQIPKSVSIGKGFIIRHFGGIVVNSKSVIGDNCTILQGVTIGNTLRGKSKGAPVIGNKVYMGPGAVIVGKITIGDNVLIAPNAYVNFDVPPNSVVVGNPAVIKSSAEATVAYITNIVN